MQPGARGLCRNAAPANRAGVPPSSPMVWMPWAASLASALGPMPLILRHASGQISGCRSASCTTEMPLGLLNSLAILASSLLGATPMEQVRPGGIRKCFSGSAAPARARPRAGPPGPAVKSMYTSSTPVFHHGAMSVMICLKRRE